MRNALWWNLAIGALLLTAVAGCRGCQEPAEPESSAVGPEQPTPRPTNQGGEEAGQPEPEPLTVPEVRLLEQDRKTCLVYVGDQLPAVQLPDISGKTQSLADLYGEKLTVVLFWTVDQSQWAQAKAIAALGDLENEVALPFGQKGVQAVAINVGNPADLVAQCLKDAQATFPALLDEDRAYFAQIATGKLPRIYLLDAEGTILWLDIEFSSTTRRQLLQGIQAALAEATGQTRRR
ncbi:MAG TPA: redoxin domain-containing protein [Planctomycetaceae bacterium]|nr:redoxin domain-containing protein [Planctomycetaceae bacterium]HIQ22587.1 redoxin domain-containing protein [Planctomycetota bacterium]